MNTSRTADGRWPVATAASLFILAVCGLALFHPRLFGGSAARIIESLGLTTLFFGLLPFLAALGAWYLATPTTSPAATERRRARMAMFAFIASEAMFFAGFFAVYLRFALDPGAAGLTSWPPAAMRPPDPWGGPLLNTAILLASGAAVAMSHGSLLRRRRATAIACLAVAVLLGLAFLGLQLREFRLATQNFDDGVYPSIFFLATGFHGLHVAIGTALLSTCLLSLLRVEHAGDGGFLFDASAWYWHFVDAVWLFLFAVFYAWAG
jgi:heme/copper-type cytochrome/quinol oxidase subunit 3